MIEIQLAQEERIMKSRTIAEQTDRGDKTMKRTTLRNMKCGIIMTVVILMISVVPVIPQSATAQSEAPERSLVGVWITQVTRRNCETGEPIAAPGNSQNTFAKGGTLLETIGPSIIRSPGNGIWKREHGWNEYSFVLRFMRFDAAGSFIGSGVVRAAITLDETGDHYTSTATNDVLDVNGNVISSGCATSVSTRFSME